MSWVDVGVDIGGTKMVLVARDADGVLVDKLRVPIGPSASPADLERIIRSFTSALAAPLRTVAIAVPGLVAPGGAVVVSDVLPGIAGWRPEVASARRPPFVVNDVRASLAYATTVSGSTDVLCVVAGTGIAAAFTNSSTAEPFHGGDGWAGELGYLPTPLADGRWGTLDDAASGAALLRRLGLAPAEVLRRIESGDQEVIAGVRAAGAALGRGIASCVNLLNPKVVFLGGGTCRYPGYADAAIDAARTASLPQSWQSLRVCAFPDGERFVADGALLAAPGE